MDEELGQAMIVWALPILASCVCLWMAIKSAGGFKNFIKNNNPFRDRSATVDLVAYLVFTAVFISLYRCLAI